MSTQPFIKCLIDVLRQTVLLLSKIIFYNYLKNRDNKKGEQTRALHKTH